MAGQTTSGHAYITKIKADGSAFLYSVTLAGTKQETATAIVVDADDNVLVAGQTISPDFPVTKGVVQNKLAGTQNIFLTKLNKSGTIMFSTYLGGSGTDAPNAIQADSAGDIYIAGSTMSFGLVPISDTSS